MRICILLIAAVFATACGHVSRQQLLMQQSGSFHNDVRWKRINEAAIRVVPWKQQKFINDYRETRETLQIEEYELQSVNFPLPSEKGYAEDPTLATIHMYRYQYVMPSVTRDKVEFHEKWVYNGDAWFIYDGY